MRKIILILIIVIFIVAVFMDMDDNTEIRVRIVPNSDSKKDLDVKEKVKNITVCYLKQAYDSDYYVFVDNINQSLHYLKEIIKKEISEDVLITFDNHTLYNKTYNNNVIENSNELTLYIEIGTGKGSNWWGTVYPEFLIVSSSEVMEYESIFINIFKKIKGANKSDKRA